MNLKRTPYALADCVTLLSGGTPSKSRSDFWGGSVPWVSAKDMKAFWVEDSEDHLTELGTKHATKIVPAGTTLLLTRGMTLHRDVPICRVRKPSAFNQDVKAVIAKGPLVPELLPYLLVALKPRLLSAVDAAGHGTGRLSTDRLLSIEVHLPDLAEQRAIAGFIDAIEEKIFLNRRMNGVLEQIARSMFECCFVEFLPVRAKAAARAEGRDAVRAAMCALSGKAEEELDAMVGEQYEELAEFAQLFPDMFVDSEVGSIPRTWHVEAIGTVTTYLSRGIAPKYTDEAGVLVINQKCIRDKVLDLSKARRHDANVRSIRGRELRMGDVLVNSTGVGTLGRVAQVFHLDEPTIADSHVTVVRSGPSITWNFLGLELARRQSEIEQLGEGSTGQTELNRSKLAGLVSVVPPREVLERFDALTVPLRQRISFNLRQNETLVQLRDTVLPKLISGEISLKKLV